MTEEGKEGGGGATPVAAGMEPATKPKPTFRKAVSSKGRKVRVSKRMLPTFPSLLRVCGVCLYHCMLRCVPWLRQSAASARGSKTLRRTGAAIPEAGRSRMLRSHTTFASPCTATHV